MADHDVAGSEAGRYIFPYHPDQAYCARNSRMCKEGMTNVPYFIMAEYDLKYVKRNCQIENGLHKVKI